MSYIAVVDYGVGNLKSVSNAFAYLGIETKITGDPDELELAQAIVLPGVGAFPDAAEKLRATGLDQSVVKQGRKKPVLGICLGMQLLLDRGEEVRPCPGLGVIKGVCARIPTEEKLPHIGWNSLTFPNRSPLFEGVDEGSYVYFVHSFSAQHTDPDQVSAVSQYGVPVIAAVPNGNFVGCQCHPEKSGETGLAILQNFAGLTR